MPYIKIKAYPKDERIKKELAERINQVFLEVWGCPQEAINLSIEEIKPSDWDKQVKAKEILPNKDKMFILDGKKLYK